jgi:hypothetical protein
MIRSMPTTHGSGCGSGTKDEHIDPQPSRIAYGAERHEMIWIIRVYAARFGLSFSIRSRLTH